MTIEATTARELAEELYFDYNAIPHFHKVEAEKGTECIAIYRKDGEIAMVTTFQQAQPNHLSAVLTLFDNAADFQLGASITTDTGSVKDIFNQVVDWVTT